MCMDINVPIVLAREELSSARRQSKHLKLFVTQFNEGLDQFEFRYGATSHRKANDIFVSVDEVLGHVKIECLNSIQKQARHISVVQNIRKLFFC